MVEFISLVFVLITLYWVFMLEYISREKIRNNTEDAPLCIPRVSTEPGNDLKVKRIIDSDIVLQLEIYRYSCD